MADVGAWFCRAGLSFISGGGCGDSRSDACDGVGEVVGGISGLVDGEFYSLVGAPVDLVGWCLGSEGTLLVDCEAGDEFVKLFAVWVGEAVTVAREDFVAVAGEFDEDAAVIADVSGEHGEAVDANNCDVLLASVRVDLRPG